MNHQRNISRWEPPKMAGQRPSAGSDCSAKNEPRSSPSVSQMKGRYACSQQRCDPLHSGCTVTLKNLCRHRIRLILRHQQIPSPFPHKIRRVNHIHPYDTIQPVRSLRATADIPPLHRAQNASCQASSHQAPFMRRHTSRHMSIEGSVPDRRPAISPLDSSYPTQSKHRGRFSGTSIFGRCRSGRRNDGRCRRSGSRRKGAGPHPRSGGPGPNLRRGWILPRPEPESRLGRIRHLQHGI